VIERLKAFARAKLPAPIYGRYRALRIKRYIADYSPRIVEHDYAGFALRVHLEDPLAEGWYDRDWEEPAEISELRRGRLTNGATVIEVGAHQGIVGLILARIVGPAGSVVAVEAEPHNAAVARRNVAINQANNMLILHAAGAATSGEVTFIEGLNGRVSLNERAGAIKVEAMTIDDLARLHGHPDVVLIDVEGFEAHVLEGATETLKLAATDFCVEVHSLANLEEASSTVHDVTRHFDGREYQITVALAGDTPPGLDSTHLESDWQPVEAGLHEQGVRCFLVARGLGLAERSDDFPYR